MERGQIILWMLVGVTLLLSGSLDLYAVEARYLPTRADESDLAVLKDLVRLVSRNRQLSFSLANDN